MFTGVFELRYLTNSNWEVLRNRAQGDPRESLCIPTAGSASKHPLDSLVTVP